MRAPLKRFYIGVYLKNTQVDFARLEDIIMPLSSTLRRFTLRYIGQRPNVEDIEREHSVFKGITLVPPRVENINKLICKRNTASETRIVCF